MARRKRKSNRGLAIAIAVVAGIALLIALNRERLIDRFGARPAPPQPSIDALAHIDPAHDGTRVNVTGKLEAAQPPRDAEIGVGANAALLFRDVEMYQWRETCAGAACRYEMTWSAQPIDSTKFRDAAGHVNPAPPFASKRFDAGGLRIGAHAVDAALVAAQLAPVALPVTAADLPPNLAATFRVINGTLYAGADPSQPQVGALKVSYRVVALGNVSLSGVQHGARLAAD